jgi:hypothetical protein
MKSQGTAAQQATKGVVVFNLMSTMYESPYITDANYALAIRKVIENGYRVAFLYRQMEEYYRLRDNLLLKKWGFCEICYAEMLRADASIGNYSKNAEAIISRFGEKALTVFKQEDARYKLGEKIVAMERIIKYLDLSNAILIDYLPNIKGIFTAIHNNSLFKVAIINRWEDTLNAINSCINEVKTDVKVDGSLIRKRKRVDDRESNIQENKLKSYVTYLEEKNKALEEELKAVQAKQSALGEEREEAFDESSVDNQEAEEETFNFLSLKEVTDLPPEIKQEMIGNERDTYDDIIDSLLAGQDNSQTSDSGDVDSTLLKPTYGCNFKAKWVPSLGLRAPLRYYSSSLESSLPRRGY